MAVNINVPSQVRTFANLAAFPATGALKTIYIAEDTNKTYRWTGSVYVEVSASASGITIGSTAIASGVVGRVLFEGAGNVVQESSSLFWDNTNARLGIGTETPSFVIDVIGNVNGILRPHVKNLSNGVNAQSAILLRNDVDTQYMFGVVSTQYNTSNIIQNDAYVQHNDINNSYPTSGLVLRTSNINPLKFQTNATERLRIHGSTGNVLINTTTDAGFRLDVNGTARVQGNVEIGGASATTVSSTYNSTTRNQIRYTNNSSFEFHEGVNERVRIAAGGNVGIGTSSPSFGLDVNGTARVQGNAQFGTGFYWDNTNNRLGIGTSSPLGGIHLQQNFNYPTLIVGRTATRYAQLTWDDPLGEGLFQTFNRAFPFVFDASLIRFMSNGLERMRIFSSTGNIGINTTTDAGYRLDVNGTARVSGNLAFVTGNTYINSTSNHMWIAAVTSTSTDIQMIPGRQVNINNTGTYTAQASAILQTDSTTKGFLPPRMTTTQKNAIATPATGLQVFDTTLNRPCFYDGTTWITL